MIDNIKQIELLPYGDVKQEVIFKEMIIKRLNRLGFTYDTENHSQISYTDIDKDVMMIIELEDGLISIKSYSSCAQILDHTEYIKYSNDLKSFELFEIIDDCERYIEEQLSNYDVEVDKYDPILSCNQLTLAKNAIKLMVLANLDCFESESQLEGDALEELQEESYQEFFKIFPWATSLPGSKRLCIDIAECYYNL